MARDDVAGILGLLHLDGSVIRGAGGWRNAGSADAR